MLKKFSVKNFKNFKNQITIDFSRTREYEFNQELIKNGLINKMLIYGENNSGKSNLGAAIMDISRHLSSNQTTNNLFSFYRNMNSVEKDVEFSYEFIFGKQNVSYNYKKDETGLLIYEELKSESEIIFAYGYKDNKYENNIKEANTLDLKKRNMNISVLKYIYNNIMYWPEDNPVKLLMDFVDNMLWFRSLRSNEFMGLMANGEDLNDFVVNNKRIKDFEHFLDECGQKYSLCTIFESGKTILGVHYNDGVAPFSSVASTGTQALWLFYYWMNRTEKISFVYLDEFDAFYHTKLSKYILKYINGKNVFQSILTTHNTFLADNRFMRPDCYSILRDGVLKSFADRTNKTIRQAHSLENMLLGNEFDD